MTTKKMAVHIHQSTESPVNFPVQIILHVMSNFAENVHFYIWQIIKFDLKT